MSPDESLPYALLPGARQAFASEDATRRFAKVAQLVPGARVLLVGDAAAAALLLALEYDCQVTAAHEDPQALSGLHAAAEAHGVGARVETVSLEEALGEGAPRELQAVLVRGARVYAPRETAQHLRGLLATDGRLGLIAPVQVGRTPEAAELSRWESLQGAPLPSPLALLAVLRDAGYEPEAVETLSPAELVELTEAAGEEASHEALAAWRERAGSGGVSYALAVGRRREPGERPPVPHDRG